MSPVLLTKRATTTLRLLTPIDTEMLFALIDSNRDHLNQPGDSIAEKYPDKRSVLQSIRHPENPQKRNYGIWSGLNLVGVIHLTPSPEEGVAEIGYWVGKQYIGQGFAQAACKAVTDYAFAQGYYKLIAVTRRHHIASYMVLRNSGFTLEGVTPSHAQYVRKYI